MKNKKLQTVYQVRFPSVTRPGWCDIKWSKTETPENGKFSGLSVYVKNANDFISHMEKFSSIPDEIETREKYEKICSEFGVVPENDESLDSYAMRYGDFNMMHYHTEPENRASGIAGTISQRYAKHIKKTISPIAIHTQPEPEMVNCSCGCTIEKSLVMSASMGSSCPDCYDRMSE